MSLYTQQILENKNFQDKFDNAKTLVEKVNVMLTDAHCTEILFNEIVEDKTVIEDVAIIQSFYGTDISRIKATTAALEYLLKSTKIPSTWIFVEGQTNQSECAFTWLKKYGIKHIFKKITSVQDGIFLKTPLWNVGAVNCSEKYLCFIDSDVCFCSSNWLESVKQAFKKYDVISLAGYSYSENDEKHVLNESFGLRWLESGSFEKGHAGFTIGMTRSVFNELNGFDATVILDDIQTYGRLVGDSYIKPFSDWIMFKNRDLEKYGMNVRLGSTECIAWHADHGRTNRNRYKTIVDIVKYNVDSLSDIIKYDKTNLNILPKWETTNIAHIIKRTINICNNTEKYLNGNDIFISEIQNKYGKPKMSDIVVCTVAYGFGVTYDKFIRFRKLVDDFLGVEVPIVFFTNFSFEKNDNCFDIIPIENLDINNPFNQCLRKDITFPENTLLYYIPFNAKTIDNKLWIPSSKTFSKNDGSILIKIRKNKERLQKMIECKNNQYIFTRKNIQRISSGYNFLYITNDNLFIIQSIAYSIHTLIQHNNVDTIYIMTDIQDSKTMSFARKLWSYEFENIVIIDFRQTIIKYGLSELYHVTYKNRYDVTYNETVNAKMLVPLLADRFKCKSIAYIDSDMEIKGSLSVLFDQIVPDVGLYGILEREQIVKKENQAVITKKLIENGYDTTYEKMCGTIDYFGTGLLLYNIDFYNKINIVDRVKLVTDSFKIKNICKFDFPEQDCMNIMFTKKAIDMPEYNVFSFKHNELDSAKIIHYIWAGGGKDELKLKMNEYFSDKYLRSI